jgi:DNA repair exonuclease SbcCD ATPase subunit
LSEALKFFSKDIKGWLERETGPIFIPVHAKSQKLLDEMRESVGDLVEVSRMLLDNSAKEIEKRNMKIYGRARALNKLARLFVDRTRQIRVPEKVSYDSLSKFVEDTQKAFAVTDVDVRNWFPRVSPFFILDRRKFLGIFERAKLTLKELGNFLAKDYVKTKTLEETFQLIDRLSALEQQLGNLKQQRAKTEGQRASVEKEIAETQQKIVDLKSKGSISQLSQTSSEIDALCVEVKQSLQHLQKPFVKLQSLATHGEGSGLTPEEVSKLYQYLENPFEAFSTEPAGYPLLKQILRKLESSISQGKLKLKPEKTRKAEQATENIANKNSLASLHQKCADAIARKTRLSTSEEVTAKQHDLLKLQEQLENFERKMGIVATEEASMQRTYNDTQEKIRGHKNEIERNILSFMGKTVRID